VIVHVLTSLKSVAHVEGTPRVIALELGSPISREKLVDGTISAVGVAAIFRKSDAPEKEVVRLAVCPA